MAVFVPPTSKSTSMQRRSTLVRFTPCLPTIRTLSCSIFRTFKMPRLSSGVEDSPWPKDCAMKKLK